jgi:hypothetical protein
MLQIFHLVTQVVDGTGCKCLVHRGSGCAALRVPEASPSLYLGMSSGITFPLNILLGIPTYMSAARFVLG